VLGTLSNAQATIQASGTATATFTAGSTAGTGSASATVDGQTVSTDITITTALPATTVTSINRADPSPTNAVSVSWTVVFANALGGLTASNFALVSTGLGGTPAITAVAAVGAAPATTWTVTASSGSGSGTLGLNLANDTNLSATVSGLPFIGQVYTLDRTAPDTTITSNPSDPSASADATFSFTVNDGSGPGVAGFECALDSGSFAACTSPQTYAGLADGSHTFQVRAIDSASNADPSPAGFTWTIDTTRPSVTINQASGQADPTTNGTINFTAVFDEAVNGFQASDVSLSGTAGATTVAITGGGTTYNVAVSGMTSVGTVIVNIPAGAATDAAGNSSAAATSTDNSVTFTGTPVWYIYLPLVVKP
jgi:hypothetical protein